MFNKLEEIIKNSEGNVLSICLDDKLMNAFSKNNKINLYSIDSNKNTNFFKNNKKMKTNKGKTINIKKLRKYINKKSVNFMFCNMNAIYPYYKYFIKDSVYLNDNLLYLYGNNEIDKDLIINNYKRYTNDIEYIEYKKSFLIIINNTNSKNNFIKDLFYLVKDTIFNIAEFIGNFLVG